MRAGAKWQVGHDVAMGLEATRDESGTASDGGIRLQAALRF